MMFLTSPGLRSRLFLGLWLVGTLASPLAVPYALGLARASGDPIQATTPLVLVGSVTLSNAIVVLIGAALGVVFAPRVGRGAPYLEGWLDQRPAPAVPLAKVAARALPWALGAAVLAVLVDLCFVWAFGESTPAPSVHGRLDVAPWRGLLAGLWAAPAQETVLRFGLVSSLAWLLLGPLRWARRSWGEAVASWSACVGVALLLGWVQLDKVAAFATVTPVLVLRTLLINLVPGVVLGRLFWHRGLEAAIIGHLCIFYVLHVLRPLIA